MIFTKTNLQDLMLIEPTVHGDQRGYFMESFKKDLFNKHCGDIQFIQDNESKSSKGVLRGLHYQRPPFAQSKLVRVTSGEVLDVVVDMRTSALTFGQSYSVVLSESNKKQLFVPKGFAHGFIVLSEFATFSYKVDAIYCHEEEDGILWNDPDLNIDWMIDGLDVLLSEKDQKLPILKNISSPF